MVEKATQHLTFDKLVGAVMIAVALWVGATSQANAITSARAEDRLTNIETAVAKVQAEVQADRDGMRERVLKLEITTGLVKVPVPVAIQGP